MLYGEGCQEWHPTARGMLITYSLELDSTEPQQLVDKCMKENNVYVWPRIDSGMRLAVVKHPTKVGKKEHLHKLLQWWTDLLEAWGNREIFT